MRDVLYIAVDPNGAWAKAALPHELVTVDYDAQDRVIGIEVIGSLARRAAEALFVSILEADDPEFEDVRDALALVANALDSKE